MNFFRNPWAIILLVVLVILLFGANKLPGLARNMGKSMRIFKTEVEEMRGDDRGKGDDEDEDDRPVRPSTRESRDSGRGRAAEDSEREYDPREETPREAVHSREDDDSYRRD